MIGKFCILLLLVSAMGCQKPEKQKKQELHLNFSSDPYTLDPRLCADKISINIDFLLFEGLTRMTPESSKAPGLAWKTELSEDGKKYLFRLRKSFWSDGHPVTAHDFESAWKTILDPLFPAPNASLFYVIRNAESAKKGTGSLEDVGIKAIDDLTLQVELEYPTPHFLELTSFCCFFPYPLHAQGAFVSNGPFQLMHWKQNDGLVLEKNPHYWESAKVKLDQIKISIVSCTNTAYEMYQKGDLDLIGLPFIPLPQGAIPQLLKKNLIHVKPVAATMVCGFNTKRYPFTNIHIRKAFSFAVNRRAIIDHITLLDETPATNLISPVLTKSANESLFKDADVESARLMLQKGLEELNTDLSVFEGIELVYSGDDLNHRIVQALQQQWKDAFDITVRLVKMEHKSYLNKLGSSDFHLVHAVWFAQCNDPVNILERFKFEKNSKNYIRWEHPSFIELLDASYLARDENERTQILKQAEALFIDEMPLVPIYHWNYAILEKPSLKGVYVSPIGTLHFNEACFE